MFSCLCSPDKQDSILEERQAQAVTEKLRFMFPVRAIPVTSMMLYLNHPDKNRSSFELEKQWEGKVENYKFKYFSSVCENDYLFVGNLDRINSLKLP